MVGTTTELKHEPSRTMQEAAEERPESAARCTNSRRTVARQVVQQHGERLSRSEIKGRGVCVVHPMVSAWVQKPMSLIEWKGSVLKTGRGAPSSFESRSFQFQPHLGSLLFFNTSASLVLEIAITFFPTTLSLVHFPNSRVLAAVK
jgi:hypothetical protein